MTGPAAEEAAREPSRNIEVQLKLHSLGFISEQSADGIFGTTTRLGIRRWQKELGRPETGFVSDADAAIIEGQPWSENRNDPDAALVVKPEAGPIGFDGKPIDLKHGDLLASLSLTSSDDLKACGVDGGDLFDSGIPIKPPCQIVRLTLSTAGTQVFAGTVHVFQTDLSAQLFQLSMEIIKLDLTTTAPQVFITGYSGGAHCCTGAKIATQINGAWKLSSLGARDGEAPWRFLQLGPAEVPTLAGPDTRLDYKFASHAGSYEPTRIERLNGDNLKDVSSDLRYRSFMLRKLREMEQDHAHDGGSEENGFLAGWATQKLLVGQLVPAWKSVLSLYDRTGDTDTRCRIAQSAWLPNAYGERSCPKGFEARLLFPQALAYFWVANGFATRPELNDLGENLDRLESGWKSEDALANSEWEARLHQSWAVITRSEQCETATASPAAVVSQDRARGLEDSIAVRERDAGGVNVVTVGEPQANGLEDKITYYRGLELCSRHLSEERRQLQDLR